MSKWKCFTKGKCATDITTVHTPSVDEKLQTLFANSVTGGHSWNIIHVLPNIRFESVTGFEIKGAFRPLLLARTQIRYFVVKTANAFKIYRGYIARIKLKLKLSIAEIVEVNAISKSNFINEKKMAYEEGKSWMSVFHQWTSVKHSSPLKSFEESYSLQVYEIYTYLHFYILLLLLYIVLLLLLLTLFCIYNTDIRNIYLYIFLCRLHKKGSLVRRPSVCPSHFDVSTRSCWWRSCSCYRSNGGEVYCGVLRKKIFFYSSGCT